MFLYRNTKQILWKNLDILAHLNYILSADMVNVSSADNKISKERLQAGLQCFYYMESMQKKSIKQRASVLVETSMKPVFPTVFELIR